MKLFVSSIVAVLAFLLFCCNIHATESLFGIGKATTTLKPTTAMQNAPVQVDTIKQLCDLCIREIKPIMKKYNMEPFNAPNQSQQLATVNLGNIKVHNLTTVQRAGDIIVMDDQAGRKVTIALSITFADLIIKSNYKVSLFPLSSSGIVTATVHGIRVDIEVLIDLNTVNVTMPVFKIPESGQITLKFDGNMLDGLMEIASNPFMGIFKNVVLKIIQVNIKSEISNVLNAVTNILHTGLTMMG